MWHCLATIEPLDPTSGERKPLHASSADLASICALDGKVWEPAIATPPQLAIRLFNGDLETAIEPGAARLPLAMGVLKETYPDADRYDWSGAPLSIYAGKEGEPWPWRLVFRGNVREFAREARLVTLRGEVDTAPFAADLLTAYEGTGGSKGGADLKGRLKPLIFGHAMNVEPVLIDAINNVYQFSGYGPIEAVSALFERGSNFGPAVGDYADFASLVAADIEPGDWATCLSEGLVRLGAPAYGVITGDVRGHRVGSTTPRLTGAIISAAAHIAGVDPALIDAATLTALDADKPFPVNVLVAEQTKFLDLARRLARPCNHQAGVSLTGRFFVTKVDFAPAAALDLDAQGLSLPQVKEVTEGTTSPPYAKFTLGANRCWRVQTPDEIAFQAEIVERGLYEAGTTYREGNIVTSSDRSRWIYTNASPSSGNAPPAWPATSNDYWANIEPPATAADLAYEDGTPIEALKPAQPGADVTGENTAADTENVNGRPAEQVTDDLDRHGSDLAVHGAAIADLIITYGSTASAAASADVAASFAQLAGEHEANVLVAQQIVLDAKDAALAAEAGATDQAGIATQERLLVQTARAEAEGFRNDAFLAKEGAEGAAATATTHSGISSASSAAAREAMAATFPRTMKFGAFATYTSVSMASPTAMPEGRFSAGVFTTSGGTATNSGIGTREVIELIPGRKTRITARLKVDDPNISTSHNLFIRRWDGTSDASTGLGAPPGFTANPTPTAYQTVEWVLDHSAILAWMPATRYVSPVLALNRGPGGVGTTTNVTRVSSFFPEDVTSEKASEANALASAESVTTVTSLVSEAEQHAEATDSDRIAAQTARGEAETIRNEVVSVKEDVEGLASSASISEGIAVSSAVKAGNIATGVAGTVGLTSNATFTAGDEGWDISRPPPWVTIEQNWNGAPNALVVHNGLNSQVGPEVYSLMKAGRTYRFSYEIYATGPDFSGHSPRLQAEDTGGWIQIFATQTPTTDGWSRVDLDYTATADRMFRPLLIISRYNDAGSTSPVGLRLLAVTDVTDLLATEGHANAAAISEANAAASKDAAGNHAATATQASGIAVEAKNDTLTTAQAVEGVAADVSADAAAVASDRQLVAQYRDQTQQALADTEDARDATITQAGIAQDEAAVATAAAAAAQQKIEIAASMSFGALNANPSFASWPEPTSGPTGWGNPTAGTITRQNGGKYGSPYALRFTSGLGDVAYVQVGGMQNQQGGWLVIEADARKISGDWAGVALVVFAYVEGGGFLTSRSIDLSDPTNLIAETGNNRAFAAMVEFPATAARYVACLYNNHTSFGNAAKTIDWYRASVRRATQAEIAEKVLLPALEAYVQQNSGAIADMEGGAVAYLEQIVAATGSNPAMMQMLAGKDGSSIGLVADVIALGNKVDGVIAEVVRVENGQARLNNALIRGLQVAPTVDSSIFHEVMLKPLIFLGEDGDIIEYQEGGTYGAGNLPSRIEVDISGLPALAEGESYDIRAINVTPSQFEVRAKKLTSAAGTTQNSGAGTFKGAGVNPQWQTNKPTAADAYDGYYQFTLTANIERSDLQQTPGRQDYVGYVTLYGRTASGWQIIGYAGLTGSSTASLPPPTISVTRTVTVQSSLDLLSGADCFGASSGGGSSITALTRVRYVSQTSGGEQPLDRAIRFTVYPPSQA